MTDFETVLHDTEQTRLSVRPEFLLVTDRPDRARTLSHDLGLIGTVRLASLHASPDVAGYGLLVGDIDLRNKAGILAMRDLAARASRAGRPVLCLLRDDTHHQRLQARALGATATLPFDVPRSVLTETVLGLLDAGARGDAAQSGGQEAAVRNVGRTAILLADLLGAAAAGAALPLEVVPEGADLISGTIRESGLDVWLDLVWDHDDATYQHCLLVAGFVGAFALGLGFAAADRQRLVGGALLHDIGKAQIPSEILGKPGRLNEVEQVIMRRHPELGHDLLVEQMGCGTIVDADHLAIVRHHHEYLDGSGYPDRLRAGQIPDIVRIVTICDIYAALLERRSYKPPMAPSAALDILREMKTQLDPDLLRVFARTVVDSAAR